MNNKKLWIAIGAVLTMAMSVLWILNPAPELFNTGSGNIILSGNTPRPVRESSATLQKHADPVKTVKIVVGLKIRDEAKLDALLKSQADPASPDYRQYLNPGQFNASYAPAQGDYDKVVDYLTGKGLTITDVAPNRLIVGATGTVDQVEKAFGVTINEYKYHGQTGISNASDPRVPASLHGIVESVIGLNSFSRLQSGPLMAPSHHKMHSGVLYKGSTVVNPRDQATVFGWSPQQIARVYNFPNVNNSANGPKYSGAGRTIAIVTAYTYAVSDVQAYWDQFGIKRTGTLTAVPVGGITTDLNDETTLDTEQIGAQAPGANLIVYEGVDAELATFTLVFNQVVVDNKADVVSVSWGLCERDTGSAQMKTEHTVLKQAAAQGIPIFAASGDHGAYDCMGDKTPVLSLDYPSADSCVTAVGGTTLTVKADGCRQDEEAWIGSGGGISTEFAAPDWQTGPGVPKSDKRQTAELSLVASPVTAYAFYYGGEWEQAGGTSFAAPNAAAEWLLCDEAAGQRIGHANEELGRIGRSPDYTRIFFDVTTGNNGDTQGPGYLAGPGWDYPTGWGCPDGTALSDCLKNEKAAAQPGK